ncbi:MAG: alpha-D-ribose 1-methylphosphonate 5-triphosphate diphosphatase [Alphaproteobacteria bacterium]|nr:alpha-D-ribose 1-methylphosphonate 5-triphosphate diphosphatase [Alphaproteobacteria bacterium]
MMTRMTITNARIVTPEAVVAGTVEVAGGQFATVGNGSTRSRAAVDFEGDYLIPGLVELHTDNLERHFAPRPGVAWPGRHAMLAHDSQVAAAGFTTVFDAICVGDENEFRVTHMRTMTEAVRQASALNVFRAEHFLHMRCEVSCAAMMELFAPFRDDPRVRLVSLMDHTPGQRQFVDMGNYREFYRNRLGYTDAQLRDHMQERRLARAQHSSRNRRALLAALDGRDIVLASHDDGTRDHIDEAVREGITIAEFPTTFEAADTARRNGLTILMGAPNLVLGGSHSGNVSALDLAAAGLLDALSSDYVPTSMLQGIFIIRDTIRDMTLPRAVALATGNPARAAGLEDRGEIVCGKRADFVRVREVDGVAVVRGTWRAGHRIA